MLKACHTKRRFHCVGTEFLNFSERREITRIPDVFLEKAPATASSQRCYGALVASYRVPTEFLLAILCALATRSLRFHGAHIACTALSRRSHCAFTAFALR